MIDTKIARMLTEAARLTEPDRGWMLSSASTLANGQIVYDILPESGQGAALAENVLPNHAAFIIAASTMLLAAAEELDELRPTGAGMLQFYQRELQLRRVLGETRSALWEAAGFISGLAPRGDAREFAEGLRKIAAREPTLPAEIEPQIAERDRLRVEVQRLTKLLPRCLGTWISGSGGHRAYANDCVAPGVWDVGLGYVCDAHKNKQGGDDDAWRWDAEADQLRAEGVRLRALLEEACGELDDTGGPFAKRRAYEIRAEAVLGTLARDLGKGDTP